MPNITYIISINAEEKAFHQYFKYSTHWLFSIFCINH